MLYVTFVLLGRLRYHCARNISYIVMSMRRAQRCHTSRLALRTALLTPTYFRSLECVELYLRVPSVSPFILYIVYLTALSIAQTT
jgi:hypothetical protein